MNGSDRSRTLILAPNGRDAVVAKGILRDANLRGEICLDVEELVTELKRGADTAIITEEAVNNHDVRVLADWVSSQQAWSDFPFVVLTKHGGGLEKNPSAAGLMQLSATRPFSSGRFIRRPWSA